MLWKSDDEAARLKQEMAELKEQIGRCHCEPLPKKELEPIDIKQFLKELKERDREEESEARYQREQEMLELQKRFRNRDERFPLERPELYRLDEKDSQSEHHQNSGGITIDWRSLFVIAVMVIAFVWFNRPANSSFEGNPNTIQPTQTLR